MDIFDMFDGLCPEDLPLDDSPIDTGRVMGLVRAGVKRTDKKPRRLRRAVRVGLIAAALAVLLSVTAYAVYEMFIDKYVIDQPATLETEEEAAERPWTRVSLTGYQGTPEYQAYTEWEAYQNDWWEKAMEHDPWKERGVDDSWHETPDNYAYLYQASFQDQADVLDAIVEKYGLTLHQDMAAYYQSKDLYEALGTEPFFTDDIVPFAEDEDVSGYIYDDGSFRADLDEGLPDGSMVSLTMFVNAKGSFAIISGVTELSEEGEAWQYTTESGESVDLYLSPNDAEIMTESAGAYISVGLDPGSTVTKEGLEAIADSIDFAVLADRFDGTAHPETADMLPILKEREQERFPSTADEEMQVQQTEQAAASDAVIDELGIFEIDPPEGYMDALLSGHRLEHALDWTDQPVGDVVTRQYMGGNGGGLIELSWYRFYPDEGRTSSATAEVLGSAREFYRGQGHSLSELEVNGCEGFVFADGTHEARAAWYDPERDLLFTLGAYDAGLDAAGAAALAGTAAVQPDPLPTPIPVSTPIPLN